MSLIPPGSILKAKSSGLSPDHVGVFAGISFDGIPWVIHSRDRGVQVTPLSDFALGRPVETVAIPQSPEHQEAVLNRAQSAIGVPFNLLHANCEHFSNWAFNGTPESPQLKKYVAGLFLAVLCVSALATR